MYNISDDTIKEAIALHKKGKTFKEIGEHYGIPPATLRGRLNKSGYRTGKIRKVSSDYIYAVGEVVNDSLIIVSQTKSPNKAKAYIVQSIPHPNAPTYRVPQYDLVKGAKCGYEYGRRLYEGNSLYSIDWVKPYVIDINKAKNTHRKSGVKCDFKCPTCGTIKNMAPNTLVNYGFLCPLCSKSTSYPELFFLAYLEVKGIEYEYQKEFSKLPNRFFDFYVEGLGVIEVHGEQHYRDSNYLDSQRTKISDKLKKEFCKKEGIRYIEVNARRSTFKFIMNSINSNDNLPSITNTEMDKIDNYIHKNRVYPIDEIKILLSYGFTLEQVTDRYDISIHSLRSIISRLSIYVKEVKPRYKPKVRCKNNGKLFNSTVKAGKYYNINSRSIRSVCDGNMEYAGKDNELGDLSWEWEWYW